MLKIKKFFLFILCLFSLSMSGQAFAVPVTSEFGWRVHPISGEWKYHTGVDLGYEYGTPVTALFYGIVCQCGDFGDGYGNQVVIYNAEYDAFIRFAHLSIVNCTAGDTVLPEDCIGLVGSSGYSTGPHLHIEFISRDESGEYQFMNPMFLFN